MKYSIIVTSPLGQRGNVDTLLTPTLDIIKKTKKVDTILVCGMHSREKFSWRLQMPAYRYMNADEAKMKLLEPLIDQLLGAHSADPAVKAITEPVFYAHECSLFDTIANSLEIQRLLNPDPSLIKQINDIIASCK